MKIRITVDENELSTRVAIQPCDNLILLWEASDTLGVNLADIGGKLSLNAITKDSIVLEYDQPTHLIAAQTGVLCRQIAAIWGSEYELIETRECRRLSKAN
ncbi:MAG: hypothetical protein ABI220_01130 [Candidatus Saccharimonadales bacterium]